MTLEEILTGFTFVRNMTVNDAGVERDVKEYMNEGDMQRLQIFERDKLFRKSDLEYSYRFGPWERYDYRM